MAPTTVGAIMPGNVANVLVTPNNAPAYLKNTHVRINKTEIMRKILEQNSYRIETHPSNLPK